MATDIASKQASGAALGVVGIMSYLAAGIQDIASGYLIEGNKTVLNGVTTYDFSAISIFWVSAAVLSMFFALLTWKKTYRFILHYFTKEKTLTSKSQCFLYLLVIISLKKRAQHLSQFFEGKSNLVFYCAFGDAIMRSDITVAHSFLSTQTEDFTTSLGQGFEYTVKFTLGSGEIFL